MSSDQVLLTCYNRGCGQKFDPKDNKDDSCQYHPGTPVFHDAYKGWSCCKKKCTDFTEFLSIKGCTRSKHCDVKPVEPEKPAVDKSVAEEVIEIKPLNSIKPLKRPSFDAPQVTIKPIVSPSLLEKIKDLTVTTNSVANSNIIVKGQSCKNNSCKGSYQGPASNNEVCIYHPGVPIFHEGMKYWSCCQKKTTDFNVFMDQRGCTEGQHMWIKKDSGKNMACRMDWHQTATHVIVSIYAKKYNPNLSSIKLNPVHLTVDLYFPEENSKYNLDIELRGIVDVETSSANMLPSKTEIMLKKKEPGSWSRLDIPRNVISNQMKTENGEENLTSQVDAVDLSDL